MMQIHSSYHYIETEGTKDDTPGVVPGAWNPDGERNVNNDNNNSPGMMGDLSVKQQLLDQKEQQLAEKEARLRELEQQLLQKENLLIQKEQNLESPNNNDNNNNNNQQQQQGGERFGADEEKRQAVKKVWYLLELTVHTLCCIVCS
jgi:hypothetical protein